MVVIPLFNSFWEFGCEVSLNPLEIAKAFNADMLREQGSNSTLKHLVKAFGEKEVKYREVVDQFKRQDQGFGSGYTGLEDDWSSQVQVV